MILPPFGAVSLNINLCRNIRIWRIYLIWSCKSRWFCLRSVRRGAYLGMAQVVFGSAVNEKVVGVVEETRPTSAKHRKAKLSRTWRNYYNLTDKIRWFFMVPPFGFGAERGAQQSITHHKHYPSHISSFGFGLGALNLTQHSLMKIRWFCVIHGGTRRRGRSAMSSGSCWSSCCQISSFQRYLFGSRPIYNIHTYIHTYIYIYIYILVCV